MNAKLLDDTWQKQASGLPGDLLSALSSNLDTGALSLTPAHVTSLNEYIVYARRLPGSPRELSTWLGVGSNLIGVLLSNASFAVNPELNSSALTTFFRQVKGNATSWEVLFGKNLQLANHLFTVAGNISRSGAVILDVCAQTKALGKRREAWDALQAGEWVSLSQADREILSSLPNQMSALKEQLKGYTRQVERVHLEGTRFRDETRMQVIPAASRKLQEVGRYIKPVNRDISSNTLRLVGMQNRFLELSDRLQALEKLLRAVLTAASHVHSTWQSLTAYIDASSHQLQLITSGQQLARFAIYFGRFLGLWKTIEQRALQMSRTLSGYQL